MGRPSCDGGDGNSTSHRGGAALGIPDAAQLKRPLREPSGHLPSASNAISVWLAPEQVGMQPQTCGTDSPGGGAAPWLRAVQRKVWPGGQLFHAGVDGGALGGGAETPETNQVRFRASHVYVIAPQLPYEQLFPRDLHAAPCAGASFGQPSVRFG